MSIQIGAQREKLADRAYRELEELIITLRLRPGSILNEPDICNELQIGRTPVREALQKLAAERLVTIQPRRAMIVSEVHASEHLIVLETRRELERLIAASAAKRADKQERAQLRDCAEAIRQAANDGDIDEFMRQDKEFDRILGQAARNPYASQSCQPLQSLSRRFWYYHQGEAELSIAADLHTQIMTAVADGEPAKAAEASDNLMDYLESAARKVI